MNALVRLLARAAQRTPALLVVAVVLLTVVFGALSGQAQQDQGQESFSPDNEALQAAEYASEAFEGSTDTIVQVVVEGEDVVSPEGLQTAQAVTEAVQGAVPADQLGGDGQPIVSWMQPIQAVAANGGIDPATLTTDEAVDGAYQQALEVLPEEVVGLTGRLVATGDGAEPVDAGTALMLVFLDTDAVVGDLTGDEAIDAQVAAVRNVTDTVAEVDAPLEVGAFAFELFFEQDDSFTDEVGRLFGTAALIILVILFLVYLFPPRGDATRAQTLRRAGADLGLTLFAIMASIVWMQGIGVLLGPDYLGIIGAFSPPTQIIPILLIGLGVDFAIHLSARYREEIAAGAHVDEAVTGTVTTVGIALTLATATTVLGFLTNVVNPVPAIKDFGILAAVGIAAAFILTMTFLPAARLLLDRRADRAGRLPRRSLDGSSESRLSNVTAATSILAERFPGAVLSVTLILGILGGYGLTQLSTEFSFADFVPANNPVRQTFLTIQDDFAGGFGEQTQVVIQGDVATPEAHNAAVAAQQNLADVDGVLTTGGRAAAQSVVSLIGQQLQLAQGMAPGGGQAEVPQEAVEAASAFVQTATAAGLEPDLTVAPDADVAAIYDALSASGAQVGAVLVREDGAYVAAQVVAQSQSETVGAVELADAVEQAFAPVSDAGLDVVATGNHIITQEIIGDLSSSQVSSLIVTLSAALLLLIVVFGVRQRRPELGVITLAPVGLVVLWVFGTMAATGIPFGPVTSTMSGLAIGIGVPFTIHITHRFTEDLEQEHDLESALRSTMRHTGGALAGSAFTTMAGFVILVSSSLIPFRQLGLVVAYAIGYSLIAGIVVLPSMLALWARWRHPAELDQPETAQPARAG